MTNSLGDPLEDNGSRCTVLICDDQLDLRHAVHDVLSDDSRFEVVGQANDAVTCLETVRRTCPDILILDVNMPGGGPRVARAVRDLQPGIYILVFSGHQQPTARTEMLAAGADDYLVKTGRLRPLLDALSVPCVRKSLPPRMSDVEFLPRQLSPTAESRHVR